MIEKPRFPILYAPDGKPTGSPVSTDFDSSRGFELPFLIELNRDALSFIPDGIQSHLAVGVGAGGDIERMQELGKYRSPYHVVGIDIEPSELEVARRRFPDQLGATYTFIQGSAEDLKVETASIDAVTFLNSWHLYPDLPGFFMELKRVLKEGGRAVGNSAYVADFQFPDPLKDGREWGNPVVLARMDLKKQRAKEIAEQGESDIPERIDKPQDPPNTKYTRDQMVGFAQDQGLLVRARSEIAYVPRDQATDLFTAKEFAAGVLPGIPLEKARQVLQRAVNATFDEKGLDFLRRYWTTLEIEKPT